jgi:PAS domain S-box-containing protein
MKRIVIGLFGAAVALMLAQYPLDGDVTIWCSYAAWTLGSAAAVLGCWDAAGRVAEPARQEAWRLLTLACGAWFCGQLIWDGYAVAGVIPDVPSPADGFWLLFALVAAVAVARLGDRTKSYQLLESLTVAVGIAGLVLALLWNTIAESALSSLGIVASVAYAVLYLSAASAMVLALPRASVLLRRRDLLLLVTGLLLEAAAFAWWAPQLLNGTYVAGATVIDLVWVLGLGLIGLGGLAAPEQGATPPRSHRENRNRSLLPSTLLIVVLATLIVLAATDAPDGARIALMGAALAMALFLLIRSWLFAGELMGAEEELGGYLALAPAMLGAANAQGVFVRVNPAFVDTLGHSTETLTTKPFFDFVHPDDVEATQQEMSGILAGQPTVHFENRYRCADGSYKWLLWSSRFVEADGLVHAAARDITEIKALQGDLERSNADLERFAYAASHDLAEPLRTISSFSQLVMRDASDVLTERSLRHLTHVTEGADRMRALIDAMLDYSRAGRHTHRPEPVDLGALVDDTTASLAAQVAEAGATITHDELPVVTGDAQQLAQLLQNLVSNAVKFRGEEDPHVHVAGRRENGGWHLEVRDNGIGVDERHRKQIFAMFERLHSRADFPGTGIGLALCAKIAERHGGRIWVDSEAGRGSTFHVTLRDPKGITRA